MFGRRDEKGAKSAQPPLLSQRTTFQRCKVSRLSRFKIFTSKVSRLSRFKNLEFFCRIEIHKVKLAGSAGSKTWNFFNPATLFS